MKKFILFLCLIYVYIAHAQVTELEYFFDSDPGYGNGIRDTVLTPTDTLEIAFTVPISTLEDGFHTLYVRAKSEKGWSHTMSRPFLKTPLTGETANQIHQVEYFINTDPGYGRGTTIAAQPNSENRSLTIDLTQLPDGFHTLYVRAKNNYGRWSQVMSRPFLKTPLTGETSNLVDQVEYFINTDPGYGNGTPVAAPSNSEEWTLTVDLAELPDGLHTFYVRAKNNYGRWSQVMSRPFVKMILPDEVTNELVSAEYYIDDVGGVGEGVNIPFTSNTAEINFEVDLAGIPCGDHILKIRGVSQHGQRVIMGDHPFRVVGSGSTDTLYRTICEGDSYLFAGEYLTETGIYHDTLHAVAGCDSIITLDLTINPSLGDMGAIQGETAITEPGTYTYNIAPVDNALLYQWQISNSNWHLSGSGNSVSLRIDSAGSGTLSVIITNECDTVSTNLSISANIVGIPAYTAYGISLYPNPTYDNVEVKIENPTLEVSRIDVYDIFGKLLKSVNVTGATTRVSLSEYANGTYLLRIAGDNAPIEVFKVVKR